MIKEHVFEDPAGLNQWLAQATIELGDIVEYNEEDQACFFRYFGEEMLEYSMGIGSRLEQIDEFVSPDG